MKTLTEFNIPTEGLKSGIHEFDFQIGKKFFDHFESSPIKNGNFKLKLHFDKRPDMLVLTFDFDGSYKTGCDRCLETIDFPVKGTQQLMVKYSDEAEDDGEIAYIPVETKVLNVATYAYESICLGIPIAKICDEIEHPPCNDKVLDYLGTEEEEKEKPENPIWDALKNFKKNN